MRPPSTHNEHDSCCSSHSGLIDVHDAMRLVTEAIRPLSVETVPLEHCCGRILREALVSDRAQPPFHRATMDGIAFDSTRATGSRFRITGLHAAGAPPPLPLRANEAWEIMTGAALPDDCDTLVPYEEIVRHDEFAEISVIRKPGAFIHEAGSDAHAGKTLVELGTRLGPVELAIAASIGKGELQVSRLPKITIITTGDEVIPITQTPQPWQIRRSNGPMLRSLLLSLGYPDVTIHHVPDEKESLAACFRIAFATSDLILLCGGISQGKRDHVRSVLQAVLGPPEFHGVSQRPGKPLAFWPGIPPVFALPGNPVSVLATFTRYVRPALSLLQHGTTPCTRLTIASPVMPLSHLTWLLPARLDQEGHAVPMPPQNSGDYLSIAGATHLLEIPPGKFSLASGHALTAFSLL